MPDADDLGHFLWRKLQNDEIVSLDGLISAIKQFVADRENKEDESEYD